MKKLIKTWETVFEMNFKLISNKCKDEVADDDKRRGEMRKEGGRGEMLEDYVKRIESRVKWHRWERKIGAVAASLIRDKLPRLQVKFPTILSSEPNSDVLLSLSAWTRSLRSYFHYQISSGYMSNDRQPTDYVTGTLYRAKALTSGSAERINTLSLPSPFESIWPWRRWKRRR